MLRECVLLPDMLPSFQALWRSKRGRWLAATLAKSELPAHRTPRQTGQSRRASVVTGRTGSDGGRRLRHSSQHWLADTSAPRVAAQDRRRLDLVVSGALSSGELSAATPHWCPHSRGRYNRSHAQRPWRVPYVGGRARRVRGTHARSCSLWREGGTRRSLSWNGA